MSIGSQSVSWPWKNMNLLCFLFMIFYNADAHKHIICPALVVLDSSFVPWEAKGCKSLYEEWCPEARISVSIEPSIVVKSCAQGLIFR